MRIFNILIFLTLFTFSKLSFAIEIEASALSNYEIQLAKELSNKQVNEQAIKLLILNTILSQEAKEILEVTPEIRHKYENFRVFLIGSAQVGLLGAGAVGLGVESSEKFDSLLAPLNYFYKKLAFAVKQSVENTWRVSEAIQFDASFRASGNILEASVEALTPLLKLFFRGDFLLSSGTISVSGLFSASSYTSFNHIEDALSHEQVRSLLSYDTEVKKKTDRISDELSSMFDLTIEQKIQLKELILREALNTAIENEFIFDKDMTIDLIPAMTKEGLISKHTAMAVEVLKEIYLIATKQATTITSDEEILQNFDVMLSLAAILDAQLKNESLSRERKREIRQELADTVQTIKKVQENFL